MKGDIPLVNFFLKKHDALAVGSKLYMGLISKS